MADSENLLSEVMVVWPLETFLTKEIKVSHQESEHFKTFGFFQAYHVKKIFRRTNTLESVYVFIIYVRWLPLIFG